MPEFGHNPGLSVYAYVIEFLSTAYPNRRPSCRRFCVSRAEKLRGSLPGWHHSVFLDSAKAYR
jgi:hypothetical protein